MTNTSNLLPDVNFTINSANFSEFAGNISSEATINLSVSFQKETFKLHPANDHFDMVKLDYELKYGIEKTLREEHLKMEEENKRRMNQILDVDKKERKSANANGEENQADFTINSANFLNLHDNLSSDGSLNFSVSFQKEKFELHKVHDEFDEYKEEYRKNFNVDENELLTQNLNMLRENLKKPSVSSPRRTSKLGTNTTSQMELKKAIEDLRKIQETDNSVNIESEREVKTKTSVIEAKPTIKPKDVTINVGSKNGKLIEVNSEKSIESPEPNNTTNSPMHRKSAYSPSRFSPKKANQNQKIEGKTSFRLDDNSILSKKESVAIIKEASKVREEETPRKDNDNNKPYLKEPKEAKNEVISKVSESISKIEQSRDLIKGRLDEKNKKNDIKTEVKEKDKVSIEAKSKIVSSKENKESTIKENVVAKQTTLVNDNKPKENIKQVTSPPLNGVNTKTQIENISVVKPKLELVGVNKEESFVNTPNKKDIKTQSPAQKPISDQINTKEIPKISEKITNKLQDNNEKEKDVLMQNHLSKFDPENSINVKTDTIEMLEVNEKEKGKISSPKREKQSEKGNEGLESKRDDNKINNGLIISEDQNKGKLANTLLNQKEKKEEINTKTQTQTFKKKESKLLSQETTASKPLNLNSNNKEVLTLKENATNISISPLSSNQQGSKSDAISYNTNINSTAVQQETLENKASLDILVQKQKPSSSVAKVEEIKNYENKNLQADIVVIKKKEEEKFKLNEKSKENTANLTKPSEIIEKDINVDMLKSRLSFANQDTSTKNENKQETLVVEDNSKELKKLENNTSSISNKNKSSEIDLTKITTSPNAKATQKLSDIKSDGLNTPSKTNNFFQDKNEVAKPVATVKRQTAEGNALLNKQNGGVVVEIQKQEKSPMKVESVNNPTICEVDTKTLQNGVKPEQMSNKIHEKEVASFSSKTKNGERDSIKVSPIKNDNYLKINEDLLEKGKEIRKSVEAVRSTESPLDIDKKTGDLIKDKHESTNKVVDRSHPVETQIKQATEISSPKVDKMSSIIEAQQHQKKIDDSKRTPTQIKASIGNDIETNSKLLDDMHKSDTINMFKTNVSSQVEAKKQDNYKEATDKSEGNTLSNKVTQGTIRHSPSILKRHYEKDIEDLDLNQRKVKFNKENKVLEQNLKSPIVKLSIQHSQVIENQIDLNLKEMTDKVTESNILKKEVLSEEVNVWKIAENTAVPKSLKVEEKKVINSPTQTKLDKKLTSNINIVDDDINKVRIRNTFKNKEGKELHSTIEIHDNESKLDISKELERLEKTITETNPNPSLVVKEDIYNKKQNVDKCEFAYEERKQPFQDTTEFHQSRTKPVSKQNTFEEKEKKKNQTKNLQPQEKVMENGTLNFSPERKSKDLQIRKTSLERAQTGKIGNRSIDPLKALDEAISHNINKLNVNLSPTNNKPDLKLFSDVKKLKNFEYNIKLNLENELKSKKKIDPNDYINKLHFVSPTESKMENVIKAYEDKKKTKSRASSSCKPRDQLFNKDINIEKNRIEINEDDIDTRKVTGLGENSQSQKHIRKASLGVTNITDYYKPSIYEKSEDVKHENLANFVKTREKFKSSLKVIPDEEKYLSLKQKSNNLISRKISPFKIGKNSNKQVTKRESHDEVQALPIDWAKRILYDKYNMKIVSGGSDNKLKLVKAHKQSSENDLEVKKNRLLSGNQIEKSSSRPKTQINHRKKSSMDSSSRKIFDEKQIKTIYSHGKQKSLNGSDFKTYKINSKNLEKIQKVPNDKLFEELFPSSKNLAKISSEDSLKQHTKTEIKFPLILQCLKD